MKWCLPAAPVSETLRQNTI